MAVPRSVANLALSFGFGVGFARGISETPQTETHAHARIDDTTLLRDRQRRHGDDEESKETKAELPTCRVAEEKRGVQIVPFSLERGIPPDVKEQIKRAEADRNNVEDHQSSGGGATAGALFHPPNHEEFEMAMGAVLSRREMLGGLLEDTQERQRKWLQHTDDKEEDMKSRDNYEMVVGDDAQSTISSLSTPSAERSHDASSLLTAANLDALYGERRVMESMIEVVRDIVSDPDLVAEARRRLGGNDFHPDPEHTRPVRGPVAPAIASTHTVTESDDELDAIVLEPSPSSSCNGSNPSCGPFVPRAEMVRRRTEWQSLVEEFQCGICRDLLACPKLADCTHSFCGECIEAYFDSEAAKGCMQPLCPMCREPIQTCTLERVLDRGLQRKVESYARGVRRRAGLVTVRQSHGGLRGRLSDATDMDMDMEMDMHESLSREWHQRRARYHALELEAKASKSNLLMAARRRRVAARRAGQGASSSSLFDHILYGDDSDSDEEGDLEEELLRLYEIASQVVLPIACAVIVLVIALRRRDVK